MRKLLLLSIFMAAMCALPALNADATAYQIRELHTSPGTAGIGCTGWVNGAGGPRLAGTVYDSGVPHAAVSDAHGDMVLLDEGFALGINSSGLAVGYADGAALWDAAGNLTHLLLPSNA